MSNRTFPQPKAVEPAETPVEAAVPAKKATKAKASAKTKTAAAAKVPKKKAEKIAKDEKKVEREKSLKPIQVVATREGFYGNIRYKQGQKFSIEGQHHFSDAGAGGWMEKI